MSQYYFCPYEDILCNSNCCVGCPYFKSEGRLKARIHVPKPEVTH